MYDYVGIPGIDGLIVDKSIWGLFTADQDGVKNMIHLPQ